MTINNVEIGSTLAQSTFRCLNPASANMAVFCDESSGAGPFRVRENKMDSELQALLDQSRDLHPSKEQLEEGRIAIAAANGALSDSRINIDTMRATRTIMLAGEQEKKAKA